MHLKQVTKNPKSSDKGNQAVPKEDWRQISIQDTALGSAIADASKSFEALAEELHQAPSGSGVSDRSSIHATVCIGALVV